MSEDRKNVTEEQSTRNFSIFEDSGGGLNLFVHSENGESIDFAREYLYDSNENPFDLLKDIKALQDGADIDSFNGHNDDLAELYTLFDAELEAEGEQESALVADQEN